MKVLIIYGTTEGHTRKIARFLEDETKSAGHHATICDASDKPLPPKGFDAVIIGASIHVEKYQSAVKHYVTKYRSELNKINSAFFSVSMSAAGKDKRSLKEIDRIAKEFCEDTGWKPFHIEHGGRAALHAV